jgi:hypothetical protein
MMRECLVIIYSIIMDLIVLLLQINLNFKFS